jgi:hypothetical protein
MFYVNEIDLMDEYGKGQLHLNKIIWMINCFATSTVC